MFAIALFLVLPALYLLLVNWQLALIGAGALLLVRAGLRAMERRGIETSRPLPSPGYLPKWTQRRRLEAARELAQWQSWFDAAQ